MNRAAATPARALLVPAEEAPHQRSFMQWPSNRRVYPDPVFLRMTRRAIADIANAIVEFEPVVMLMGSDDITAARRKLSAKIDIWDIPTEDLWCRDAGPIFAVTPQNQLVVSHIRFNGWGGKQVHEHDARIAARVAERLGLALISSGLQGEAGGVEQDGHGRLFAHASSWLGPGRNPGLSQGQIGERLLAAYGADNIVWSPGLAGQDITDYHIDSLARFTGPGRVLINLPQHPDPNDPFHMAALDTHQALLAGGLSVEVIPEPTRPRIKSLDFVASYANYYVCNGAVIAAQFGDSETDTHAAAALACHYPGREIVMLNADPLGELGGGIHCATQQMPQI